jgi:hypothetical protein
MFENLGKLSDSDKKGGEFSPYKKGAYILTVAEAVEGETEEREWVGNGFVPTGNMIPQLTLRFDIENSQGNNEIEQVSGETLFNAQYMVWINSTNTGWNRKSNEPRQGRAVLAALLGVKPDGDISFENSQDLVGKKMKVYMGIEAKKNGGEKNVLLDIEPYKE